MEVIVHVFHKPFVQKVQVKAELLTRNQLRNNSLNLLKISLQNDKLAKIRRGLLEVGNEIEAEEVRERRVIEQTNLESTRCDYDLLDDIIGSPSFVAGKKYSDKYGEIVFVDCTRNSAGAIITSSQGCFFKGDYVLRLVGGIHVGHGRGLVDGGQNFLLMVAQAMVFVLWSEILQQVVELCIALAWAEKEMDS